ncbi:DUF4097 family beta strand repeat-containing protein [Cryobacterium cryoconiti]|nr:DUF4097 family beta strand repeat-containing protein [Cryobacterium cryoconiti]
MSRTPPPPQSSRAGLSPGARTALIVALVLGGVVTVVGLILIGSVLRGASLGGSYTDRASVDAGSQVLATVPNASVTLSPSTDGQVYVDARGTYLGKAPKLRVSTSGDVTTISGGCPTQWFGFCSVDLAIRLPADVPVTVLAQNGRLSTTGLTGSLDLATTNGRIQTDGSRGDLDLRTTNGGIDVRGSSSGRVSAATTNGSVELDFIDPPSDVDARSTNGRVVVRVPDDGEPYRVDARTTNGGVDSASVPTDPSARRSITAVTTNGTVAVETR